MQRLINAGFTAALPLLISSTSVLAHHKTSVGWDQGYPVALHCGDFPGTYPRYRIRILIENPEDFDDPDIEDVDLHMFLREFNVRPIGEDLVIHWDSSHIVDDHITFQGFRSITYNTTFPYPKARLRAAWVKYGNTDNGIDRGQLNAVACVPDTRYFPDEGEVGPVH